MQCPLQMVADRLRLTDFHCILCNRSHDICYFTFLNAAASDRQSCVLDGCSRSGLSRKYDHGDRTHPASENACDRICRSRTCCDTDAGHFTGKPCVGFRCHTAGLLVVLIRAVNLRVMTERVIHVHRKTARYRKYLSNSGTG